MINSLQQPGQPGEVVCRHVIGVLEVIKRVGREDDDDNGDDDDDLGAHDALIGAEECTCPDQSNLFTELDVLKLSRFASTTAAIISNANLLGNLAKKVRQHAFVTPRRGNGERIRLEIELDQVVKDSLWQWWLGVNEAQKLMSIELA